MALMTGFGLMIFGCLSILTGYVRMVRRYPESSVDRRRILWTMNWTLEDNRAGGFLVAIGALFGFLGTALLVWAASQSSP